MAKLTTKIACDLARSLANVTQKEHFGSDAFYSNKRIFATVWHDKREVNLRLTTEQQRHFLSKDGEVFVEINNAWGRQGWTKVQIDFAEKSDFLAVLTAAWSNATARRPKAKPSPKKKVAVRSRPKRKN